jgi:rod shape determining protein RodA
MTKNYLPPIAIGLGILFCFNMLMVSSVAPYALGKQLFAWLLGVILFFIGTQINPRQIASSKVYIFLTSCFFLLLPILLNNITRGARSWINLGFISFQPSEFVKPWLMLFLVHTNFPLLIFIPIGIVMLQPDLGSAITIGLLLVPIILYNKQIFKLALLGALLLIMSSPLIWSHVLHGYQRQRIVTFLNPQSDPQGHGYNIIQSKIAIGSGGLWGKGYKKGSQGQLLFLPAKHTDFMFAVTAEELGLVGVSLIIFSYYLITKTLINRAFEVRNNRPLSLFILGIAFQVWGQSFINIGVNLGMIPVTGIPLPFMSVGGSSIMALMFSLGVSSSS